VIEKVEKMWWVGAIALLCVLLGLAHGVAVQFVIWGFPLIALVAYLRRKLHHDRP
jgi:D-alanyl-lipoteichoic acid acyltransferase DltB (MBOAT superfamily)